MYRILFIISLVALFGCRTVSVSTSSSKEIKYDSVFNEIVDTIKTTSVVILPDSALIRAYLECDSMGQVHIRELEVERGRTIIPKVILKDNILLVPIKVDSLRVYNTFKDRKQRSYAFVKQQQIKSDSKDKTVYKTSLRTLVFAFIIGFIISILIFKLLPILKNR